MREPFLSETPRAFRKIPNRSGGAGRKGVEGKRNSHLALASVLVAASRRKMKNFSEAREMLLRRKKYDKKI